VPKERAPGESRVALAPYAAHELARAGHRVLVEAGAGEASSIPDERYEAAGARISDDPARVYGESELVVKVQGPVEEEREHLKEGTVLFSFLSLSVDENLMQALIRSRCVAVALETIRDRRGGLPVLTPMSEIAGRLTPQIGAHYLQHPSGGRGILLGGSAGVRPGRVVILGGGIVGSAAARVASGLGARVLVMDRDLNRLRRLEETGLRGVSTLAATHMAIRDAVLGADLLIGAVLVVGSRTPHLVDRATVEGMKPGSVIVDVDVDQGGVVHYCVKNVPAAVPVTSTRALSNALLPYVREVAGRGLADAINADAGLGRGVAVADGRVVDPILARATGSEHNLLSSVLPLHSEAR
jgi:alanine dehydrogenase